MSSDLGDDLSTAQRTLLEVAAQDVALLAVADTWLREHATGVINRKRKTFVPLVAERLRVASHLADVLKMLGLERRARPVASLEQLLAKAQADEELEQAKAKAPVDVEPVEPEQQGDEGKRQVADQHVVGDDQLDGDDEPEEPGE